MKRHVVRSAVLSIAVLVMMVLLAACGNFTGSGGQETISGSIVSVDMTKHTVTLNVNGQTETISGIPDNVLQSLQSQVGKMYSIQVTQNSDGSFNLVSGTNLTPENDQGTPEATGTSETSSSGSIEFVGTVKSVASNSLSVSMPNGLALSMSANGTDLGDFNNAMPAVGTLVKVKAVTNPDGSFNAESVKTGDATEQNNVTYKGVATSAVGSDHLLHFVVGKQSFSFPIASSTDLSDFNGSTQSIQNGSPLEVEVLFNGTNGTVTKVKNNN